MVRQLPRSVGLDVFGLDASAYDTSRLGYPRELFDAVFSSLSRAEEVKVVEVGSGTGLATQELLARRPSRLVAIEPDQQMAALLSDRNASAASALEVINKPFEAVDLTDQYFDLACAASSIHWLEPNSTVTRLHKALKAGGTIALWWNVYRAANFNDAFAEEVIPMLTNFELPPSEASAGHISLDRSRWFSLLERCGFNEIECEMYRRERTLDAPSMQALYASYSFVRVLSEAKRAEFLDKIGNLVETRFRGHAPNVVLTPLYTARRT